jgi:hypothetical protein
MRLGIFEPLFAFGLRNCVRHRLPDRGIGADAQAPNAPPRLRAGGAVAGVRGVQSSPFEAFPGFASGDV